MLTSLRELPSLSLGELCLTFFLLLFCLIVKLFKILLQRFDLSNNALHIDTLVCFQLPSFCSVSQLYFIIYNSFEFARTIYFSSSIAVRKTDLNPVIFIFLELISVSILCTLSNLESYVCL